MGQADLTASAERLARLRLARAEGIGPITFGRLLARCGSAVDAIDWVIGRQTTTGRGPGPRPINIPPPLVVQEEVDRVSQLGAAHVFLGEPAYPARLAAIPDPPPVLTVKGPAGLDTKAVAIVGTRNASAHGRKLASLLAADLGAAGWTVVSGLARGIDGAAHTAALGTGTIAVVAGGVDQIYPPEHRQLTQQIAQSGAIVSERPPGCVARARDFPKRNRIVSGLSAGVIVVEAAERSGTLITARLGLEQGRDIFAVPGSPLDPRAAGTNRLLRQGAILVRNAEDVLEALSPFHQLAEDPPDFGPDHGRAHPESADMVDAVRGLLSFSPVLQDVLVRELGAPPAYVADALLELVLTGVAEEVSGAGFVLCADADNLRAT